ncbi:MAG: carboxypeptidase regulatory-like domain-containing protein [Vicinamibacteria bacterium]
MRRFVALLAMLALGFAPAALAQSTGNIYGTVTDDSGAVLPGVSVTLTGAFGTRTTTTNADGAYRFANVDHGSHKLTAALTGFASVSRDVIVNVGRNLTIDFGLKVASVQETVTVSAETPVVDTKKLGTATTITKAELSGIPTSRDPWALMRTVPGVLVDRVNVGGSESGQQSGFMAKGADAKDSVWSLDGIVITDQVSMSSPSYFNYDTFDEVNFSTGGSDISQSAGGIGIGLVTKRGTNAFHGNLGGYFTHDDLQSSNIPAELQGDARLQGNDKADHTEQISDYSFDLGGPIVKDKLWFYGAYGKNDIRIKSLVQNRDKTILKNYSAKVNWQASQKDMISAFWFNGAKVKIGRANSALQEDPLHQVDQGGAKKGGPEGLSKLEWNRVWSPSLFSNFKAGYYNTGFTLASRDLGTNEVIDNVRGQARGAGAQRDFLRPQYTGNLDFSYFAPGMGGNHEVKFGVGYRRNGQESIRISPGADQVQIRYETNGINRARFYRDGVTKSRNNNVSLYASDTFTKDRLTLNLGLRFDHGVSRSLASGAAANPAIPTLLPALEYAGTDGEAFTWDNLSPRGGFTYALDESRKTVVRASYARYAGLVTVGDANWDNPVATGQLTFPWADANSDGQVQLGEVNFNCRTAACGFSSAAVDPNNPTSASSPNLIDPDYKANTDDEIVVGLDRELLPNLAISAAYTWRKSNNLTATQLWSGTYWYNWVGADGRPFTAADYVQQPPVTANGFTATSYLPSAAAEASATGGVLLTNRKDYHRTYNGFELSAVKRLSNRWMGRAAFSWMDWKEHYGPGAINNPTRHDWDPLDDGGPVVRRTTGSGKVYYVNAKWQFNANALVQLPHGFDLAGNVYGRQGYPNPVYLSLSSGFDGTLRVLADGQKIDSQRLPNLWNVDVRLAKQFKLGGTNLTLSAEAFNVFNGATELKRLNQANSASYLRLDEILAPRIVRFGARINF